MCFCGRISEGIMAVVVSSTYCDYKKLLVKTCQIIKNVLFANVIKDLFRHFPSSIFQFPEENVNSLLTHINQSPLKTQSLGANFCITRALKVSPASGCHVQEVACLSILITPTGVAMNNLQGGYPQVCLEGKLLC